jgi:hypothetical protein
MLPRVFVVGEPTDDSAARSIAGGYCLHTLARREIAPSCVRLGSAQRHPGGQTLPHRSTKSSAFGLRAIRQSESLMPYEVRKDAPSRGSMSGDRPHPCRRRRFGGRQKTMRTPETRRRATSAVTSEQSCTAAVAAMNRSAGSLVGNDRRQLSSAIAEVRGASRSPRPATAAAIQLEPVPAERLSFD